MSIDNRPEYTCSPEVVDFLLVCIILAYTMDSRVAVPDPAKRQSTLNTWQRNDYRHEILHFEATWLMHAQFLLYSTCQPGCK